MNVSRLVAAMLLSVAGLGAAHASCTYDEAARTSWKSLFRRQLTVLDPAHAGQMSKVAADIIDGDASALTADLAGVDVNYPFKLHGRDMSMLDLAASACQIKIVRQLVGLGANVDGLPMSTPLVSAAGHGQDDIVDYLLNQGAHIAKVDANGHTALEEAVRQRALPATRVLLAHGDDVNRPIAGGARILDLVNTGADADSKAVAEELRRHAATSGATTGAGDGKGRSD